MKCALKSVNCSSMTEYKMGSLNQIDCMVWTLDTALFRQWLSRGCYCYSGTGHCNGATGKYTFCSYLKSRGFVDMTPCSAVNINPRFGRAWCRHLQSWQMPNPWIRPFWTLKKEAERSFKRSITTKRHRVIFQRAWIISISYTCLLRVITSLSFELIAL
jgi:hypothetical protein